MQATAAYLLLISGLILIALIIGMIIFRIIYNRYLNKRLKGEVEKRKFFNFKIFVIIMGFMTCLFFITYLWSSLSSALTALDYYQTAYYEKTYPRSVAIYDIAEDSMWAEYRDSLQSNNLPGYKITVTTDGDFECYAAYIQDGHAVSVQGGRTVPFIPQYIVYIRYVGEVLDDMQTEQHFFENEEEDTGWGSTGEFKPETLLVGNTLEPYFYFKIKTIIKIAPHTQETKLNWKNIPIHAQSTFVISIENPLMQ